MFDEELSSLMPGLETWIDESYFVWWENEYEFSTRRGVKLKICWKLRKLLVHVRIKLPWTDKEIDIRQHWILVSNLMSWTKKQPISEHFPRCALRDKFRQILFLYWGKDKERHWHFQDWTQKKNLHIWRFQVFYNSLLYFTDIVKADYCKLLRMDV